MNYLKVSIKEELPIIGKYVTTIDINNEHRVYRLNIDGSWTMRDCDGINSPANNTLITHWLKAIFSEEAIKYLESRYWISCSIDKTEFTRKSSHDNGCDTYSLRIDINENIVEWSMTPVNIDCDTGKYDTQFLTRMYKTFNDFKKGSYYTEDRKII